MPSKPSGTRMCCTLLVVLLLNQLMRVNFVALDRDQAAAGVRRGDADLDFVAGVVLRLSIELHLQLGIFVERALDFAATDDGERKLVPTLRPFSSRNSSDVIARLAGRELDT